MASTSECSRQLDQLKVSDGECMTRSSSEGDYVTASEGGTPPLSHTANHTEIEGVTAKASTRSNLCRNCVVCGTHYRYTPRTWRCMVCEDYLLCESCHINGSLQDCEAQSSAPHGHNGDHDMSSHEQRACCDGCGSFPIWNQRWHCTVCRDFDLCEACYAGWDAGDGPCAHSKEHPMLAIEVMRSKWYRGQSQDGSKAAADVAASAGGSEQGSAPFSAWYLSAEEQIERSKSHWSLLADESEHSSDEDEDEVVEESNRRVFETLQQHPTWGGFFGTFGYDTTVYKSAGELRIGEKFAEGGQGELFHAYVTWSDCKYNDRDVERGWEWVVKVFKKGTKLCHLQCQLPRGMLQFQVKEIENSNSPNPMTKIRFHCLVQKGILLEDGRFAFLMKKEHFDLRTLIERNMELRNGAGHGPFSKEDVENLMFEVALGVDWLHGQDIVHRDLKASNVLIREYKNGWPKWTCLIADYECSNGVVGTGFFRAPEILQACKEGNVYKKHDVFTKAVDVYGYGMICYEILTGKLPFEGHAYNDYNDVLNGERPVVPKYVEDWTRELLHRCWESNPKSRPTMVEILNFLVSNSMVAKYKEASRITKYGYNYRMRKQSQIEK